MGLVDDVVPQTILLAAVELVADLSISCPLTCNASVASRGLLGRARVVAQMAEKAEHKNCQGNYP